LPADPARPELAYGVAPDHRGKGVATRSLRAVSDWLFDVALALNGVELRIDSSNVASRRVAEKAGFSYRGDVVQKVPTTGERYEDLLYVREKPS
jgi:RimJ/RimL family protein N-acetyltransferase